MIDLDAEPVTVRVPGKVNLALGVGPVRSDGFHELVTVFQAVSLHDEVQASPAESLEVLVEGEEAGLVPLGSDNLAHRAAVLLARRAGVPPAVQLRIRKSIPVAGGMAGGSADAAAALVACDALWHTGLDRAALHELAATLGSDVPFCLHGGTAVGRGRGEMITPALARGRFEWVLALAEDGLSTPEVFAECDRLRTGREVPDPKVSDGLMAALRAGDPAALGESLSNDLQDAACSLDPRLHQTLEVGRASGALGAVVSGSGPTVAFLVADADDALDLAVSLGAAGVCRAVRRAYGPVPGARVLPGGAD